MPIAVGGQGARKRTGGPGSMAIPGSGGGWSTEGGAPSICGNLGSVAPHPYSFQAGLGGMYLRNAQDCFRSPKFSTRNTTISGVTRDSASAAVGNCTVELLQSGGDIPTARTVSDASGNYLFNNPGSGPFYIVAYKAGAPDIAGTTVNTLIAN
jgi:hypothetical protein